MTRNPFGLLNEGLPQGEVKMLPPTRGQSIWQSLLIGVVIGVASILAYQRFVPDGIIPDGDDQEQVEPSPNVAGKTLVLIHERNPQSIEHDILLRELPAFCKSNSLAGGFRALDDDLQDKPVPELIQFAQTRGVMPPCVILTDKNDKPFKAATWPASLDELKAFIR